MSAYQYLLKNTQEIASQIQVMVDTDQETGYFMRRVLVVFGGAFEFSKHVKDISGLGVLHSHRLCYIEFKCLFNDPVFCAIFGRMNTRVIHALIHDFCVDTNNLLGLRQLDEYVVNKQYCFLTYMAIQTMAQRAVWDHALNSLLAG